MKSFLKVSALILGAITGMVIAFVFSFITVIGCHWFTTINQNAMIVFVCGTTGIGALLGAIASNRIILKRSGGVQLPTLNSHENLH